MTDARAQAEDIIYDWFSDNRDLYFADAGDLYDRFTAAGWTLLPPGGGETREEWGYRTTWADGTSHDNWTSDRDRAETNVHALAPYATLIRRAHLTLPAETVTAPEQP